MHQPSLAQPASAVWPSYFSRAVVAHSTGGDNTGAGSPLLSLVNVGQLDATQETGNG